MKLANLLGLLGLLSIVILILIYIIKPNFQQKYISTTFVWKLSLRYRKKRVPISKLRNILLVICQVLILASCALILARPVVVVEKPDEYYDKIVIVDASANMRAKYNGETRFQRAIEEVEYLVEDVFEEENGRVSIIFAGSEAKFLSFGNVESKGEIRLIGVDQRDDLLDTLDGIVEDIETRESYISTYCSYTSADLEGAINLAEEIFKERDVSPKTEVVLYSGIKYQNEFSEDGRIKLVDISLTDERNAAILDATATINESGFYTFSADIAVYGQAVSVDVEFEIHGPNQRFGSDGNLMTDPDFTYTYQDLMLSDASMSGSEQNVVTIRYDTGVNADTTHQVSNFDYVGVKIKPQNNAQFNDVFDYDNEFWIYGGRQPQLTVSYFTDSNHLFYKTLLDSWQNTVKLRWNVNENVDQSGKFVVDEDDKADIYIFEHGMPEKLPENGAVIFLSPRGGFPDGAGLTFNQNYTVGKDDDLNWESAILVEPEVDLDHPLLQQLKLNGIKATEYQIVTTDTDGEYIPLLTCENNPVFLVKNTPRSKIMALCLDVASSNLVEIPDFPLLIKRTFDYFFPSVVSGYGFEVGEKIEIKTITDKVTYTNSSTGDVPQEISEFPCQLTLDTLGTYEFTQQRLNDDRNDDIKIRVYVKVPAKESNIFYHDDVLLTYPVVEERTEFMDKDLLVWFAAALVALLFAEWCLQLREQF